MSGVLDWIHRWQSLVNYIFSILSMNNVQFSFRCAAQKTWLIDKISMGALEQCQLGQISMSKQRHQSWVVFWKAEENCDIKPWKDLLQLWYYRVSHQKSDLVLPAFLLSTVRCKIQIFLWGAFQIRPRKQKSSKFCSCHHIIRTKMCNVTKIKNAPTWYYKLLISF